MLFGLTWEGWFSIAGSLAMLGWAILILAPRRWPALNAAPFYLLPALLSGGYAVLILLYFADAPGGFDSLAGVARLFESEPLLLAGWIHYLAFDLFVGGWIARRADAAGISRVVQAPILATTFMLGPIGLLLYLASEGALRAAGRRALA
ncbi:MAG: ABA4-like family protein [Marivibrio sp.]|uniref:ABA4-like family protein n=1 Tax=Marivibrio sp. TaxID=2039719 RepID=UPI0032EC1ECE